MKSKKQEFYEWYKINEDKLKPLSCHQVGKLFAENNNNFLTTSSARTYTNDIRSGKLNDEYFANLTPDIPDTVPLIEDISEFTPNFDTSFFESNMVDLPTSWSEGYVPFEIRDCRNLGVCSDIHLPYHDQMALSACFAEFKRRNVDGIYLNGDQMDFEKISKFGKIPDGRYLKDEIEVGLAFLKALRRMFPNIPIFWKDGNHEFRLQRYINERCPELSNLYGMDTPSMMRLNEFNIQYIPENIVTKFGKLYICHGHELNMGSGSVNVARQVRLRVGVSCLVGHWHKSSHDQSRNLADESHAAWALGCLCYLKPRYTGALNQWNQGAATVEILNEKGEFRVNTFSIINGRVH